MRQNDFIYNTVSVIFLLLSVMVCLIALAWTTGTINVPGSLAPATDVSIPTAAPRITFTPSVTPPITRTPFPSETPFLTETPVGDVTETVATPIATEEAGG